MKKIRVTVWNEYRQEKTDATVRAIYPDGIHGTLAAFLRPNADLEVRTATLDESEHGLTQAVLNETDVLIWWGHHAHHDVHDAIVERVHTRVLEGMGILVLHSAHFSKIFRRLMGTNCTLACREAGEKERLWVIEPSHPIVRGLGTHFEIPREEMYGERFDIPQPDCLVLAGWFQGGELFRSGCCWRRGHGKVFYFQPGHETYPVYHLPPVQTLLTNATRWLAPASPNASTDL